jgi:hypothetical protein
MERHQTTHELAHPLLGTTQVLSISPETLTDPATPRGYDVSAETSGIRTRHSSSALPCAPSIVLYPITDLALRAIAPSQLSSIS